MPEFVHLHLHSEYSLLDSTCRIRDIPKAAAAAGQTAVALTDHGVLYGAVAFYRACLAEGIHPIIGCEIRIAPPSRFDSPGQASDDGHLVLLVENEIGYRNLIALVSSSFTESPAPHPHVDIERLRRHSEGLIALSGCMSGEIPQKLLHGDWDGAQEAALRYADLFGPEHFYLELQDHGTLEQKRICTALLSLSEKTGIPIVATNNVHYLRREDAPIQAALLCIQTGQTLQDGRQLGFDTDEYYLKTGEEIAALFSHAPQAVENTAAIARRCRFDFTFDQTFLPRFRPEDGSEPAAFLRKLARQGLARRIALGELHFDEVHSAECYGERMEYELSVIHSMGYDEYYLIVWDFVHYARTHHIPTGPGRGSGAGSLVAFLIGITEVDSIRYGLLFERFLNPERISMPDFDIDFCDEKREKVIEYVMERYGRDHVSQIITFGTMAARAVLRDVGRVLEIPHADVDAIARMVPQRPGITLATLMKRREIQQRYQTEPAIRRLLDLSLALEGMPRHISVHAAGVVITDQPIHHYVPLAESGGTTVTQYDMDTIAALGLLKFDFLGLRYLTVLEDTENQIKAENPSFSLEKIPQNDPATYALLTEGKTEGVFQLESHGMRQMLGMLCPHCIEDLMVAIALYRPGPMDSIPRYLAGRKDPESVVYTIPALREILGETYGCMVYQEQVMQICRKIAGYSFGQADLVRKAMSKKKADVMERERETFLAGAAAGGIEPATARALFDEMAGFASYAFNKSHAAAYALTAYRTAYCKANHRQAYMAALLTSVFDSLPKMAQYITDCERAGIPLLPPDINQSEIHFRAQEQGIRFGLAAIRGIGVSFASSVMTARGDRPFASFLDFLRRMPPRELSTRVLDSLIRTGCFDSMGINRRRLIEFYPRALESVQHPSGGHVEGQIGMFDHPAEAETVSAELSIPEAEDYSLREKLTMEKQFSGFCFSGHWMDDYRRHIEAAHATPIADILAAETNEADLPSEENGFDAKPSFTVAGLLTRCSEKRTRKGETMAFLTLEDRFAEIGVLLFPAVYSAYASLLKTDAALLVQGDLIWREGEPPKIAARALLPLLSNDAAQAAGASLPLLPVPPHRPTPAPMATAAASQNKSAAPQLTSPQIRESRSAPPTPSRLYLRLPDLEGQAFRKVDNLLTIFDGPLPVCYYSMATKKYYARTQSGVMLCPAVQRELRDLLGEENVVLR